MHGIYATADAGGRSCAQAIFIPAKPKNNQTQLPAHATAADVRAIGEHAHDLAMFAREVMLGFDERGDIALNPDGSPVIDPLPALISPLAPLKYLTT